MPKSDVFPQFSYKNFRLHSHFHLKRLFQRNFKNSETSEREKTKSLRQQENKNISFYLKTVFNFSNIPKKSIFFPIL